MKRRSLLVITFFVLGSFLYAQNLYNKSITFEHNSQLVEIDTSQPGNIWQIGIPKKNIFDSAYSAPYAIITDTLINYPNNNISSFQVKIYAPPLSCWGEGYLSFKHRFDTEFQHDGGYIEVQYDADTTWTNVLFDENAKMGLWFNDFYNENDTIVGNISAFSGSSDRWINSHVEWIWFIGVKGEYPFFDSLTIRFTFQSDNNLSPPIYEGWLIDDISLALWECTGSINESNDDFVKTTVFPNPVENTSVIEFENKITKPITLKVFSMKGQLVKEEDYQNKEQLVINKEDFKSGLYIYQIEVSKILVSQGKFLVAD